MEYPGDRDDFWTIIYDYKQYFVQQTKDPFSQRETYTCHGAQELIPFTEQDKHHLHNHLPGHR